MTARLDVAVHDCSPVLVTKPETDIDFASRRLAAMSALVSQAGRVITAARAAAGSWDEDAHRELRVAIDDYDHAAARAAALNEGNGER